MEPYSQMTMQPMHEEALDFTSNVNVDSARSTLEPPVLDLSCKKTSPTSSSTHTSTITSPACSNSPTNMLKTEKPANFADSERKSPFEGRSFMVTPPSESDSPKKTKYEPIYNCPATNTLLQQPSTFPTLPMNIPMPIVPTVLPGLLAQNNQLQIVGAPATSTTTTSAPIYQREVAPPSVQTESSKKAPRPFKAYPKDPLSLTMGTAELMYDPNSNEAYSEFRKRMLESVRRSNEGTNIKMRRVTKSPGLPTSTVDEKDAAYWERRRKNNEAAKRSRDARRAKEDEIAIRAAFLEQENMKLKYELVALRNETAKLRCMVYST